MKTLPRLLFAAAIAGAAVTVLARLLGTRARSDGDMSNSQGSLQDPPLAKPEPLRVPLGEILEAKGTRLG
jgi:hypothetical protein